MPSCLVRPERLRIYPRTRVHVLNPPSRARRAYLGQPLPVPPFSTTKPTLCRDSKLQVPADDTELVADVTTAFRIPNAYTRPVSCRIRANPGRLGARSTQL